MGHDETMSPDTVSSKFPDRPIRPLPTRRLRERLSPAVADSIEYPPAVPATTPLFYYPYNGKDDDPDATVDSVRGDSHATRRSALVRASTALGRSARPSRQEHSRHWSHQAPPSTDSSADGYDSFENTNNKKKRKIPTAGDPSINGRHSLRDVSPESRPLGTAITPLDGHSEGSLGLSGPGRGRLGRAGGSRIPLRPLTEAGSNSGRSGKVRHCSTDSPGIISTAIANATAEKSTSNEGQENLSLLQQQSTKANPASTQFTFTCDSQVPGNVPWPGSDPKSSALPLHQQGQSAPTHWQQGRVRADQPGPQPSMANTSAPGVDGTGKGGNTGKQSAQTKKKSRNRLNKELEEQAKARKKEQEAYNFQNPPGDDMYICPFCEFESIYQYKPKHLIRAFEMKERRKRLEAEQRQRLLEKAKARGRKGKKGKQPAKSSTVPENPAQPGQQAPPMNPNQSQETRSDDYDDEEDYGEGGEGYEPGGRHPDPTQADGGRTVIDGFLGDMPDELPDGLPGRIPGGFGGGGTHRSAQPPRAPVS